MEGVLRAEVSAGAFAHNVGRLRERLPERVEICAVVKADAYGHGLEVVVPRLAPLVDRMAVTLPSTALRLRELGWRGPVLTFFRALGAVPAGELRDTLEAQIAAGVTLTITSADDLAPIEAAAAAVGREAEVHLKLDTGMTRSGVLVGGARPVVEACAASPVRLAGVYTQLASADSADLGSAHAQLDRFDDLLEGAPPVTRHAANSAGVLALPRSHYDLVRPGLALYGAYPSVAMARPLDLRPALRVVARLIETKTAPAGSATGYGGTHTFAEATPIGLVPIGYADGYPRRLGGVATMRLRGRDVPVCGRVSMDQAVVDLSAVPEARVGDEIEVISNDPDAPHSLERLAALADTIPYEICCALGARATRIGVA